MGLIHGGMSTPLSHTPASHFRSPAAPSATTTETDRHEIERLVCWHACWHVCWTACWNGRGRHFGAADAACSCQSQSACETARKCQLRKTRIESLLTVTQGDPNPLWSAPVPTIIPPTPPMPQIVEPSTDTGPILEQSGGASQGRNRRWRARRLPDCMSLWDKDVHMTKALWKTVCVRTMNGIDEPSEGAWHSDAPGTLAGSRLSRHSQLTLGQHAPKNWPMARRDSLYSFVSKELPLCMSRTPKSLERDCDVAGPVSSAPGPRFSNSRIAAARLGSRNRKRKSSMAFSSSCASMICRRSSLSLLIMSRPMQRPQ